MTFQFEVGKPVTVSNPQSRKGSASGDQATGAGPFTIECFDSKAKASGKSGKTVSSVVGAATEVAPGGLYSITSGGSGGECDSSRFPAETACTIAWNDDDGIAREQRLEIHTSCSKALHAGDQFGSLLVAGYSTAGVDAISTACSAPSVADEPSSRKSKGKHKGGKVATGKGAKGVMAELTKQSASTKARVVVGVAVGVAGMLGFAAFVATKMAYSRSSGTESKALLGASVTI